MKNILALTATKSKKICVSTIATWKTSGKIDSMPTPELPANTPPGSTIRKLRKLKDWSHQELANRSGVDKATISRYERNQRFEMASLKKIADGLQIDFADLFTNEHYAAWKLPPTAIRDAIQQYAEARIELYKQHKKITNPKSSKNFVNYVAIMATTPYTFIH